MKIILASKSPARRKLFKELGIPFMSDVSNYDEDMNAHGNPAKLAKFLALEKARYIAKKHPSSIIIGADTFVMIGKKKIGKPDTHDEAAKIISRMSNHHIDVHSGIAVVKTDTAGKITAEKTDHAKTTLHFAEIPQKDIEEIIRHDDVLEISGAFSIEGMGGKFVKEIDGDYNNVIGLPLIQLKELLTQFGVKNS